MNKSSDFQPNERVNSFVRLVDPTSEGDKTRAEVRVPRSRGGHHLQSVFDTQRGESNGCRNGIVGGSSYSLILETNVTSFLES